MDLMSLLQGASGLPNSDDILVQGRKPSDNPLQGLGNQNQLSEAADAAKNAPQREGYFHTKGTLRDILGTLGDAFLIQSGHNAIYTPQRQREKIADAYSGFTGVSGADPDEVQKNQMAALERLAATPGGTELAQKAYAQMQDNNTRMAANQNQTSYKNDSLYLQKIDKLGKLASNIYAGTKTPQETEAATQRLIGLAQALKVDPADLGVKPGMSPEDIRSIALGNQTPYQQAQVPIQQQNANSRQASVGVASRNAGTNVARLAETGRHNKVTEAQGGERLAPVDSQTNLTRDENGRVINATTTKTRGGHSTSSGSSSGGPTKGMRRVINGKVYEWDGSKAVPVGGSDVPLAQ